MSLNPASLVMNCDNDCFVRTSVNSSHVFIPISKTVYNDILEMIDKERDFLITLEKSDKSLWREMTVRSINASKLFLTLRSREEITMLEFVLICSTLTDYVEWTLPPIEDYDAYKAIIR